MTLFVLFLVVAYRLIMGKLVSYRAVVLSLMTAVVLASLVGVGMAQRLSRDSFDHARATVRSGTGPLRFHSIRFARDPDFDLERLRPMIREGENNDREWAFMILKKRKNRADLERFLPEIAELPEFYFEENNYRDSDAWNFQFWIEAIGVNLDEVTRRVDEIRQIIPPNP